MRRIATVAILLLVAGGVLALGFWPAVSMSGAELDAAEDQGSYPGYSVGSRILVREKVLDAQYANVFGNPLTAIELEDGNPDATTTVYVRGDARGQAQVGSYVYMDAVLQEFFGAPYWEVASPQDVHPSSPVDTVFYGLMGLGVVLLVADALRSRSPRTAS